MGKTKFHETRVSAEILIDCLYSKLLCFLSSLEELIYYYISIHTSNIYTYVSWIFLEIRITYYTEQIPGIAGLLC